MARVRGPIISSMRVDIDLERVGRDVDERRHQTGAHHRRDVGGERHRRRDDLVAGLEPEHLDGQVQRRAAGVAHHAAALAEQLGDRASPWPARSCRCAAPSARRAAPRRRPRSHARRGPSRRSRCAARCRHPGGHSDRRLVVGVRCHACLRCVRTFYKPYMNVRSGTQRLDQSMRPLSGRTSRPAPEAFVPAPRPEAPGVERPARVAHGNAAEHHRERPRPGPRPWSAPGDHRRRRSSCWGDRGQRSTRISVTARAC